MKFGQTRFKRLKRSALKLSACAAGFAILAFSVGCSKPQVAAAAPPPAPVLVGVAEKRDVPLEIIQIGTVEQFSQVEVRTHISGELTGVLFKEGDDVRKGQPLFTLDRRPLDSALHQAQGDLARDQASLANARTQLSRYESLWKEGVVAKEQYDQVRTQADVLASTVQSDMARVETAKVNLLYASIASPIDGRTGSLMVHLGNEVKANDTGAIVVINQVQPIYVTFAVPQDFLAQIRARGKGLLVTVTINGDSRGPITGHLQFIDNGVDPTTGTIKLKAIFTNADRRLWPGQFVNVALRLQTDSGVTVVPSESIQTGQAGQFVFVVKADDTVEQRPVTVIRTQGALAVIQQGVTPGERVVTDGQVRLVPGGHVEVKAGLNTAPTSAPAVPPVPPVKAGS